MYVQFLGIELSQTGWHAFKINEWINQAFTSLPFLCILIYTSVCRDIFVSVENKQELVNG